MITYASYNDAGIVLGEQIFFARRGAVKLFYFAEIFSRVFGAVLLFSARGFFQFG